MCGLGWGWKPETGPCRCIEGLTGLQEADKEKKNPAGPVGDLSGKAVKGGADSIQSGAAMRGRLEGKSGPHRREWERHAERLELLCMLLKAPNQHRGRVWGGVRVAAVRDLPKPQWLGSSTRHIHKGTMGGMGQAESRGGRGG